MQDALERFAEIKREIIKISESYVLIRQNRNTNRTLEKIQDEDFDEDNLYLNGFDFLNNEIPFEIDVPNITHKEALHLNKIINLEKEETDFIEQKIISPTDLEKYKLFYKYMPNFYDVRL